MRRRIYIPIVILGLIILAGAFPFRSIEGYWISKHAYSSEDTVLLVREYDKRYVNVYGNWPEDSIRYFRFYNQMVYKGSGPPRKFRVRYKLDKNKLVLIRPKVDSIIFSFKRPLQEDITQEILATQPNVISLPSFKEYSKYITPDLEYNRQIFLTLREEENKLYFLGKSYKIDSTLYKVFLKEVCDDVREPRYSKIFMNLFIDKQVPYKSVRLLQYNLAASSLFKTNLIFDSPGNFDQISGLPIRVYPLNEDELALVEKQIASDTSFSNYNCFNHPPPPPPFGNYTEKQQEYNKKHMVEIIISGDLLQIANETSLERIKKDLHNKMANDSLLVIGCRYESNATYMDYLNLQLMLRQINTELRNKFCQRNYGRDYDDKIREERYLVRAKFPLKIVELYD